MLRDAEAGYRVAGMTLPSFFVVGAAKAGTTSLYEILRRHPQVFMPPSKEPGFFSELPPAGELRFVEEPVSTWEGYLELFRNARGYRAVGEASPSYLWAEGAAARIRAAVPDAKIVVTLRDPLDRLFSHYLMDVCAGIQPLPLYEAVLEDLQAPKKAWGISHLYVELGLYSEQVARYLELFGRDRVKILLVEDLRHRPAEILADLARFLSIDPNQFDWETAQRHHNAFLAPRGALAGRILQLKKLRWLGRQLLPAGLKGLLMSALISTHAKPAIDLRVRELVGPRFEADLQKLEQLLSRKLPALRAVLQARQ